MEIDRSGNTDERGFSLDEWEVLGAKDSIVELFGRTLMIRRGFIGKATYEIDSSVSATVESAGNITNRPTLTRTAAGAAIAGPVGALVGLAARKKVDKRELYLLIEAEDWAEVIELRPQQGPDARRIAQKINLLARRAR